MKKTNKAGKMLKVPTTRRRLMELSLLKRRKKEKSQVMKSKNGSLKNLMNSMAVMKRIPMALLTQIPFQDSEKAKSNVNLKKRKIRVPERSGTSTIKRRKVVQPMRRSSKTSHFSCFVPRKIKLQRILVP